LRRGRYRYPTIIATSPAPNSAGDHKDAVLEDVSIGQAGKAAPGLVRAFDPRLPLPEVGRSSVYATKFAFPAEYRSAPQVRPRRKGEEAGWDASIEKCKRARSAVAENRDFCNWHRR